VTVHILESGEMIHGLSADSKLISLSRKTPALLDMAATENGYLIGQYSSRGTLGHSGDCNSVIGGVPCLHHELTIKPSSDANVKLYFLAGYSSKPLKAWRDSRVFWIVYDSTQEACWLVPHDLSHNSVGDTVSATMPLVSKSNPGGNSISVLHLPNPVQASLATASPLNPNSRLHQQFLQRCLEAAHAIDWTAPAASTKESPAVNADVKDGEISSTAQEENQERGDDEEHSSASLTRSTSTADGTIAIFDGCSGDALLEMFPQIRIQDKTGRQRGVSLSPMYGPLKVFAGGCCANSRVVVVDANVTCATSEINSVFRQLSGIILIQMKDNPDIYKLHQIRWNMARAARTAVLALTPDGCKHLCGPMPPCYVDEEYPTPVAGTPVSDEAVRQLVEFALSKEGDDYFGPLYPAVPSYEQVKEEIANFIADMEGKDFASINDVTDDDDGGDPDGMEGEKDSSSFRDNDFRRLMELINTLSVSTSTAVERNNLAIRLSKFLRKTSKTMASKDLANNVPLHKHEAGLEILSGWNGENLDWAVEQKGVLNDILRGSNVKIEPQKGVEIDLALQKRLDDAIQKKRIQLNKSIGSTKSATFNSWKKTFDAVFHPPLESLMRSIGDNPRYRNYFPEVKLPNMSGVIIRASQSTNKQSVASNPEDVMKLFHKIGATGFVRFTINFLQTWKTKVINEICLVDRPGEGFNNPETFVPVSHRLEDERPADPVAAYETDVRHQFVLPTFRRLPKMIDDDDDDDDDEDEDVFKKMPAVPADEDLAEYLLMRKEFMLRNPEQGPRHPMWQYVDWLFHQIKVIHQVPEKQAAPLAMRALAFSILRLMNDNPHPEEELMEIVASIVHAINFMSARGDPVPHGCIDTFFNMGSTYIPMTKYMEQNPWQIEVVNILSRAVDYIRPIMSAQEYVQIRSNFQRAAANMVKRQIVQKLLDHVREEAKNNGESHKDYVACVNNEFYPAYREVVETIGMLIGADPTTFQLTGELKERIEVLHHTIVVKWSKAMRRCRVGPVREMVKALKSFSEQGGEAMAYLVSRKRYLAMLYDQVYHLKYESCDQVLIEEVCRIIKAKSRNPQHEKHEKWQARVDQAKQDILNYDTRMAGFAHGNNYKSLPTELMLRMLNSLEADPASDTAVTFANVQALLAHVNIDVRKPADLKKEPNDPDGGKSVFEQLRGAWWMCPDAAGATAADTAAENMSVPSEAMIAMGAAGMPADNNSSNILATLGDTYYKFELAKLFSGQLKPMRDFIRENYKFHLKWFEETIRAAGLPRSFVGGPAMERGNEVMAVYAIVQRLVSELAEDGADRGDRARNRVYGEVVDPLLLEQVAENGSSPMHQLSPAASNRLQLKL
jgi:hypothetical protein